jgi:protein TonB
VEDSKNVPEGERPGRFSKAPETGAPATGDIGKTGALAVPNLTIREDQPKPVKLPNDPNARAILYAERVRTIPFSTLSVPLRPSSRTVPRTVEARFPGRNVYTMVVPIENLPTYSGDWIIWFAERQPVPGETPLIRAPLPYRKMEPVEQKAAGNPSVERVQISAILEKDGRLAKIAVSTKAGPDTEQAVIQDLESWEFKPATRDGVPVDVEVVIEIAFNLPASVAKRVQPWGARRSQWAYCLSEVNFFLDSRHAGHRFHERLLEKIGEIGVAQLDLVNLNSNAKRPILGIGVYDAANQEAICNFKLNKICRLERNGQDYAQAGLRQIAQTA